MILNVTIIVGRGGSIIILAFIIWNLHADVTFIMGHKHWRNTTLETFSMRNLYANIIIIYIYRILSVVN